MGEKNVMQYCRERGFINKEKKCIRYIYNKKYNKKSCSFFYNIDMQKPMISPHFPR